MRGPPCFEIVKWVLHTLLRSRFLECHATLAWHPNNRLRRRLQVLEVWETLSAAARSLFFSTLAPDGSEDDQIHCLKEGQPCQAGQDRLASMQQAPTASRATDPFAAVTLSDPSRRKHQKVHLWAERRWHWSWLRIIIAKETSAKTEQWLVSPGNT